MLQIQQELKSLANPEKAKLLQKFFKTGKGEYAEGDIFLGIPVPVIRQTIKNYFSLEYQELSELLNSKIHEERLAALLILTKKFKKAKKDHKEKYKIHQFYLDNTKNINNWDLVDLSAPNILGEFLLTNQDQSILKHLAKSNNLWEKRIAVISTLAFIKKYKFGETLALSQMLINDEHDLIHKAVGWMLREIGKRNIETLEIFLKQNYKQMPRTMLRYSIEKFPKEKRQRYLKGEI
ncbi:DNA alkylation repair protein [Candidatus Pacearchaeota archaeon]|nr:DNA alkylation repair protein [Candidatus Pacearchaeota archaeon]